MFLFHKTSMFDHDLEGVTYHINNAFAGVQDYSSVLWGNMSDAGQSSIHRLKSCFGTVKRTRSRHDDLGTFKWTFLSQYVSRKWAQQIDFKFVDQALSISSSLENPSLKGWMFELDFRTRIINNQFLTVIDESQKQTTFIGGSVIEFQTLPTQGQTFKVLFKKSNEFSNL